MLIAHSSRGCVTSCPFGPNAVGLQYGLHGLGWSQRLSVISRIKGAEQWPASQKFAACTSESLTALTDSDCKLTALLQFTRDWDKLRFASLQNPLTSRVIRALAECERAGSGPVRNELWVWLSIHGPRGDPQIPMLPGPLLSSLSSHLRRLLLA